MDKDTIRKIFHVIFRTLLFLLRRFTSHSRSDGGRIKKKEDTHITHDVTSKEMEE